MVLISFIRIGPTIILSMAAGFVHVNLKERSRTKSMCIMIGFVKTVRANYRIWYVYRIWYSCTRSGIICFVLPFIVFGDLIKFLGINLLTRL